MFKGVTTNGAAFHLWVWVKDWVKGPPDSCHACCLCWGSCLWSAAEPLGTALSVHLALARQLGPDFPAAFLFLTKSASSDPSPASGIRKIYFDFSFFFCVPGLGSTLAWQDTNSNMFIVWVLGEFNSVQQICSEFYSEPDYEARVIAMNEKQTLP